MDGERRLQIPIEQVLSTDTGFTPVPHQMHAEGGIHYGSAQGRETAQPTLQEHPGAVIFSRDGAAQQRVIDRPLVHGRILELDRSWRGPVQMVAHEREVQEPEYFYRRMSDAEANVIFERGGLPDTTVKGAFGAATTPSVGILTDVNYATRKVNKYHNAEVCYSNLVVFEAASGTLSLVHEAYASGNAVTRVKGHGRTPAYRIQLGSEPFHEVNNRIKRLYRYQQEYNPYIRRNNTISN